MVSGEKWEKTEAVVLQIKEERAERYADYV